MITSGVERARVEQLIVVMREALVRIATAYPPADARLEAEVRAAYTTRLSDLQEELRAFRDHHVPGEPPRPDRLRVALSHISTLESALLTLRGEIARTTDDHADNARTRAALHEELNLCTELLGEWQLILEELDAATPTSAVHYA